MNFLGEIAFAVPSCPNDLIILEESRSSPKAFHVSTHDQLPSSRTVTEPQPGRGDNEPRFGVRRGADLNSFFVSVRRPRGLARCPANGGGANVPEPAEKLTRLGV